MCIRDRATGTLEPGYFRPIISRFDELARGHSDRDLAKQLPNQLVGVFLIARNFSYQLLQGECYDEICSLGDGIQDAKCRWVGGARRVFEAVVADDVKSCSTLLPLGHYVMEAEACLLARIAEIMGAIPGTVICEYSTDNCLAWRHKHRVKRVKKELLELK